MAPFFWKWFTIWSYCRELYSHYLLWRTHFKLKQGLVESGFWTQPLAYNAFLIPLYPPVTIKTWVSGSKRFFFFHSARSTTCGKFLIFLLFFLGFYSNSASPPLSSSSSSSIYSSSPMTDTFLLVPFFLSSSSSS